MMNHTEALKPRITFNHFAMIVSFRRSQMNIMRCLLITGFALGHTALLLAAEDRPQRPNVILIISDDQGYADVGYQGMKDIPTPNIDALARSGVRFSNGYVSCPVCSPTRAGLMTGRYQQRFGFEFNPGPGGYTAEFGLPLDETTIADRMKAAGYRTGAVGKWHLGSTEKFSPTRRGFDEFFGFPGGGHDYFRDDLDGLNPIRRNDTPVAEDEYLTDAFTREAVDFIDRHAAGPFFLYLAYNAVHSPMQASDKYLERFASISDQRRRAHAAMMAAMDDGIGRVLDAVRTRGLEDRTLIFFLADNGGPTVQTTSSNRPLRGVKGQVYEGGIRVPFLVSWKGHLAAGKVYDRPVISLDIFPTALAAAGGAPPQGRRLDGINLLPYLSGEKQGEPHESLCWRFGPQAAIRRGDWKLIRLHGANDEKKTFELYNLAEDVAEEKNLAGEKPDIVNKLTVSLDAWNAELVEPLWRSQGRRQADAGARTNDPAARRERRAQRQQRR
jgi:arylsulfatase A-like enzyme